MISIPAISIEETLRKFQIDDGELERVRTAGRVVMPEVDAHIDTFYAWLSQHAEYDAYFARNPTRLERVKQLQRTHWATMFEARVDEAWFASRRHVGAVHAQINLPNDIYFAGMSMSSKSLVDRIRQEPKLKPAGAIADAVVKMVFLDTFVVIDEIARIQREKLSLSSKALLEMSTPVTPIWALNSPALLMASCPVIASAT